jgi:hypothetical protein
VLSARSKDARHGDQQACEAGGGLSGAGALADLEPAASEPRRLYGGDLPRIGTAGVAVAQGAGRPQAKAQPPSRKLLPNPSRRTPDRKEGHAMKSRKTISERFPAALPQWFR